MKKTMILLLVCSAFCTAQLLRVDSVTVDSVRNADSAGTQYRDCIVSFVPAGHIRQASCEPTVSFDGGLTWHRDAIRVLARALDAAIPCGVKKTVTVRIPGGDRENVVIRVTARLPLEPAPEWVRRLEPGKWAAVSLNTLSSVDPARDPGANPNYPNAPAWRDNQQSMLGAWNGGAFATGYGRYGALVLCGGGHADYYGNEVYAFDLENRLWKRLTNPYPTPSFPVENGIWPDGTPSVSHTYDQSDYHPLTNSFVMMKTQFDNTGGRSSPVVAMFCLDSLGNPDSNVNRNANKRHWRLSNLNTSNYTNSGGWSVYDSRRDLFWANGGSGTTCFASFDPKPVHANGRYGVFGNYTQRTSITDVEGAYDPSNDIVVFTIFRNAPTLKAFSLSHPAGGGGGNTDLIQTGTPPDTLKSAHGWEWSPARNAFLYYRRGIGVYEFKLQGSNWRTDPWKWTLLTSPDNAVIPGPESGNGVYSKFRIARFADAEIALVVTGVRDSVYAFRLQ